MGDFLELIEADRRLVILRCLSEDAGYSLNESVIQSALVALGHNVSRDRVRTDLEWLKEQGLVNLSQVMGVTVAYITGRGEDAAWGRVTVPGVKRPRPRCL